MRNNENAMALQLYKGQYFTFINGNEWEATPGTNPPKKIVQLQPGDNCIQVDTLNGLTAAPPIPYETGTVQPTSFTDDCGTVWNYPIAAAPVDLILPAVAEAAGKFYSVVMQCGSETCRVLDKETGTVLFESTTTGETILLHCNGYAWLDITMAQLVP